MRYDDYRPENERNDQEPVPEKKPLPVGAVVGIIALAGAVGLSIVLLSGLPERLEERAEVANRLEDDDPPVQSMPADEFPPEVQDELPPEPPQSPAEQLRDAQAQVESLQTELDARSAELASVKAELADHQASDAAARERAIARQAAVQHQIDGLRDALKEAQDERDTLRKDLKEALAEVDRQVAQNTKLRTVAVAYKQASNENLWAAFTNNAKVRICDRGTHRRRESCEEELDQWFDDEQHAAFTSCVGTFQAIPLLWKAEDDVVPAHAEKIDARDRERRDDWYVVYCDPTLPEGAVAKDITEEIPQVFAMR